MKLNRLGALAVAATLAAGACTATPAPGATGGGEKGEIEIWSSLPRQGSSKGQTDTIVNGIQLALEEQGETIEGWRIKYEDKDDSTAEAGQWTQDKEIENATGSANNENVIGYIGPFNSGAAQVGIPIICAAGLAQISPANTYPGLTKPGKGEADEPDKYYANCKDGIKTYHRVIPADDLQGAAAAKWAAELGFETVYAIDDSQLYGKGIADVFRSQAPDEGLEIVGSTGILGTETDYKSLAEQIRGLEPDLVYFGGITQQNAGQLWRDIREALPDVNMMGPDGILEEAFLEAAGDAAEGTYITFGGLPAEELTGKGAEFVEAYEAKFGTLEAYTAYGYEAANVMLDAIERAAQRNPANKADFRKFVVEEVKNTKDYEGALGTWSFDENGDTTLTAMSGNVVENGEFRFETIIE